VSRADTKHEVGFTLLEVLVATAILGTAVAALFSLLSGSLSGARRLQAPEQVLMLARTQLNDLLASSERGRAASAKLPLDQQIEGRWGGDTRWEAEATRVPAAEDAAPGQPILVRVVLNAFWRPEGRPEKRIELETYELWQEPLKTAQ
jgi:type II secretion system protein I